jgi:hypothetical protein
MCTWRIVPSDRPSEHPAYIRPLVRSVTRLAKAKRALDLNEQAKATGLRGDERLLFIADKLRIKTNENYRQVGRLLAEGKKQMRLEIKNREKR